MRSARLKFRKESIRIIFEKVFSYCDIDSLSKELGVSKSAINNWMYGNRLIPEDAFQKICERVPEVSRYSKSATRFEPHWGQQSGGKTSTKNRGKLLKHLEKIRLLRYRKLQFELNDDGVLEFFGVLMGDGYLCKYVSTYDGSTRKVIFVTGHSENDLGYFVDFLSPLIRAKFGSNPGFRKRKNEHTIDLMVYNAPLFSWLESVGFPSGKKGELRIPKKILVLGLPKINKVIRGIFDTDGFITARKDEKYRYPHIIITSTSNILRKQLVTLLRKQGMTAYIYKKDVILKGKNNFRLWFSLIGTSHPLRLAQYNYFNKYGRLDWARRSAVDRIVRNDEAAGSNPAGSTLSASK